MEDKTLNPIFIQEHDDNVTELFSKYFDVSQIYFIMLKFPEIVDASHSLWIGRIYYDYDYVKNNFIK